MGRGLKSLLEKILEKSDTAQHLNHDGKMHNKHTTKELELLDLAIKIFWENHDPKAPPKKDIIVEWLVDQGISKGVAESLDTAMRTKDARKGGNKRVTPT